MRDVPAKSESWELAAGYGLLPFIQLHSFLFDQNNPLSYKVKALFQVIRMCSLLPSAGSLASLLLLSPRLLHSREGVIFPWAENRLSPRLWLSPLSPSQVSQGTSWVTDDITGGVTDWWCGAVALLVEQREEFFCSTRLWVFSSVLSSGHEGDVCGRDRGKVQDKVQWQEGHTQKSEDFTSMQWGCPRGVESWIWIASATGWK